MKRKDREALMNMSAPEIEKKLLELRTRIQTLQFQKHAGKLKNPHEIGVLRKDVARMLTAQRHIAGSTKLTASNSK